MNRWGFALAFTGFVLMSGVPAMAETVTQLNITGGTLDFNLGALGNVSGSFNQTGTLVMGSFQSAPPVLPSFLVDGHAFSLYTDSAAGLLSAPSAQTSGTTLTADLSSLFALITGPRLNGALNIGGLASGTYDPLTGAFSLSWTHVYDLSTADLSLNGTADVAPVPLPAAVGFFTTGLLGVMRVARRRAA